MVSHDDVCESCGGVGRTCRMRWPDGETREMCGPCERQWQLIWRLFCERQPRQANRVRARANRDSRARPDGGEPLTDGGQPVDGTDHSEGYLFTEIDYYHPFDAPEAESVSIITWYQPTGCRASTQGGIDV